MDIPADTQPAKVITLLEGDHCFIPTLAACRARERRLLVADRRCKAAHAPRRTLTVMCAAIFKSFSRLVPTLPWFRLKRT